MIALMNKHSSCASASVGDPFRVEEGTAMVVEALYAVSGHFAQNPE